MTNEDEDFEIEEVKLESENVHKALLEYLFQECDEINFGPKDGLARIDHIGHGEYRIVKSYVDIREKQK